MPECFSERENTTFIYWVACFMNERNRNGVTKPNIWIMNHYATDMYKELGGRHFSFALHLIRRGYKTSIICASTIHNSNEVIETGNEGFAFSLSGEIPFVIVKTSPYKTNSFDRIKNMFTFARNVVKLKKKLSHVIGVPDVIIASSVHPLTCIAGLKLGKFFKVPVIVEIRDLWPETLVSLGALNRGSLLTRILYLGEKAIYRRADAVIFTIEGGKQYLVDKQWAEVVDLEKVFYINNGVDLANFVENANEFIVHDQDLDNEEQLNFVYTGSLRRANNIKLLIDAFKNLKNDRAKLLIWGSGDQKQELEDYCFSQSIANVNFKGNVQKNYIPSVLKRSYINILHYGYFDVQRYGMSQNKLFEYLAAGKPILAIGGFGFNIVDSYDCGMTSDGTLDDIVEKLQLLSSLPKDEYDQLSYNCRKTAKLFDFSHLTSKLEQVIDFVLPNKEQAL